MGSNSPTLLFSTSFRNSSSRAVCPGYSRTPKCALAPRISTSPRLVLGYLRTPKCYYAAALDIARCRAASTGQRKHVLILSTPADAASPPLTQHKETSMPITGRSTSGFTIQRWVGSFTTADTTPSPPPPPPPPPLQQSPPPPPPRRPWIISFRAG